MQAVLDALDTQWFSQSLTTIIILASAIGAWNVIREVLIKVGYDSVISVPRRLASMELMHVRDKLLKIYRNSVSLDDLERGILDYENDLHAKYKRLHKKAFGEDQNGIEYMRAGWFKKVEQANAIKSKVVK